MTRRERVMAAIAGQPVDRAPFSLWYHFNLKPPTGEGMARAELDFYRRYNPDILKVMHDISYEMPEDMPQVRSVADWQRLPVLDGVTGHYGAQLETLKRIVAEKGDDVPVVATVYGLFMIAQRISGRKTLEFLRADPGAVHAGLRSLAASIANFARVVIASGVDGIFLAVQGAASDTMSAQEYRENFLAYEQQILDATAGGTVNIVHHHGIGIYPDPILGLRGYHIYSWSDRLEGNPDFREMRLKTTACLMGGVNEMTFGAATPEEIVRQVREIIAITGGRNLVVGPGCSVPTPPDSPDANLLAFRHGVME